MAGPWSDEHIAASLNRMGMPTGQSKTWTAHRVSSLRRVRNIHAYKPAEGDGQWLSMSQAATKLGATNHRIRSLIKQGLLTAEQWFHVRRTKSVLLIWKISGSSTRSRDQVARVAARTTSRSQCFQALEEEGSMSRPSRSAGSGSRPNCCRWAVRRHRRSAPMRSSV